MKEETLNFDETQWKQVIEPALRYPSGDNAQPFNFLFESRRLLVFHDSARGSHSLNPENYASLIALGAFLVSLEISAASLGFSITVKLAADNFFESDKCWAEVLLMGIRGPDINLRANLLGALANRRTDRAAFKERSPLNAQVQCLRPESAGVFISYSNFLSEKFIDFAIETEKGLWSHAQATSDVFSNVHLTAKSYSSARWGLYWKELGLRLFELPLVLLLRRIPDFPRLTWNLGFKRAVCNRQRMLLKMSSGFALFSLRQTNPESFVELGREIQLWWLKLTAMGGVAQPLTACSLAPALSYLRISADFTVKDVSAADFRRIFESEFRIDGSAFPVWLFRFGEPVRAASQSLRMEIHQLHEKQSLQHSEEILKKLES